MDIIQDILDFINIKMDSLKMSSQLYYTQYGGHMLGDDEDYMDDDDGDEDSIDADQWDAEPGDPNWID